MAETKTFEYIIQFEPYYMENDDGEMCFKSRSVQELIRCCDCKWMQCNIGQDGYLPQGVPEFECRKWCYPNDPTDFCSWAEKRGDTQST